MPRLNIRTDYYIDVPEYGTRLDIDELKSLVTRSGSHFFDRDTMRFFRSRVDDYVYPGPDGWYFVTSEKHVSHFANINEPRLYTVRRLSVVKRENGSDDLGLFELEGFQPYRTLDAARRRAKYYAGKGAALCPKCQLRLMLENQTEACTECAEREANRAAYERKAVANG
jgi:hypothetical protein